MKFPGVCKISNSYTLHLINTRQKLTNLTNGFEKDKKLSLNSCIYLNCIISIGNEVLKSVQLFYFQSTNEKKTPLHFPNVWELLVSTDAY